MRLKEPIATLKPSEIKMEAYAGKATLKKKPKKSADKKTAAKKSKKKNLSMSSLRKMFN